MFFNNPIALIVAIVVAFVFFLMVPADDVLAAVELTYSSTSTGGEWRLEWDHEVAVDVLQHDRELVLNFDRPLDDVDLSVLQGVFPEWIESVRYGYDSLLVRFAPTVVPQLLVSKQGIIVQMRIDVRDKETLICSQRQLSAGVRLRYLEAVAQMELGQLNTAKKSLQKLAEECPKNGDILLALGQAEERAGRWFVAIDQYEKAHLSGNVQAGISKSRLRQQHDDQVKITAARLAEAKNTKRMSETVTVRHKMADNRRVSIALSSHDVHAGETLLAALPEQNHIAEGRISLESVVGEHSIQEADLILLSNSIGFGIHHHYFADDAKWIVSAEMNALDTTQVSRIIQEAHRDVIGVQQHQHRKGALQIFYHAEAVRYHLDNLAYWAGGYAATFDYLLDDMPFNLLDNMPLNVSARYSLDGEHSGHEVSSEDTQWAAFIPENFENHNLSAVLSKALGDTTRFTLELGYTWDRLGGGEGPYQAMSASRQWEERTVTGFSIRNGRRESGATDDTVFQLEGTVQVPF